MKRPTITVFVSKQRGTPEERAAIARSFVGRSSTVVRSFEFSDAEINAIHATMPVEEVTKHKWIDRLRLSVDVYLASRATRLNDIRKELERLVRLTRSLRAFLDTPETAPERMLREEVFWFLFNIVYESRTGELEEHLRWSSLRERAEKVTSDLEFGASAALAAIGRPVRGAPENLGRSRLGSTIARQWKEFTGSNPGFSNEWQSGPYAEHLKAVLAAIPEQDRPPLEYFAGKSVRG